MLTKSDKNLIKQTSRQIINGSGEQIIRRRLITDIPPHSYDSDFGEVVNKEENRYSDITFTAKVFYKITDKRTLEIVGELKIGEALLHIPYGIDVISSDIIFIRGIQYKITELKEAPLKGFYLTKVEQI